MNRADKIKDMSRQAIGYLKLKRGDRDTQGAGGEDMAAGKASEDDRGVDDARKRGPEPPDDKPAA